MVQEKILRYIIDSVLHKNILHKMLIYVFNVFNLIGFDFKVVDHLVDFYVIIVLNTNNCTNEFKDGGTIPINGSAPYTMVQKNYILYYSTL